MSRCSFQPCAQYMVTRNKSPTICSFLLLRHSVEQMPTTLTIKDFPFSSHLISNVMAYFPDKNSGIVIHSTLQLMIFLVQSITYNSSPLPFLLTSPLWKYPTLLVPLEGMSSSQILSTTPLCPRTHLVFQSKFHPQRRVKYSFISFVGSRSCLSWSVPNILLALQPYFENGKRVTGERSVEEGLRFEIDCVSSWRRE